MNLLLQKALSASVQNQDEESNIVAGVESYYVASAELDSVLRKHEALEGVLTLSDNVAAIAESLEDNDETQALVDAFTANLLHSSAHVDAYDIGQIIQESQSEDINDAALLPEGLTKFNAFAGVVMSFFATLPGVAKAYAGQCTTLLEGMADKGEKLAKEKIEFAKMSLLGVGGEANPVASVTSFSEYMSSVASLDTVSDILSKMVGLQVAQGDDFGTQMNEAVGKLAEALGLKNEGTDGRFGKGISYFHSAALPSDKALFLSFDGAGMPALSLRPCTAKTHSYSQELDALTLESTNGLIAANQSITDSIAKLGGIDSVITSFKDSVAEQMKAESAELSKEEATALNKKYDEASTKAVRLLANMKDLVGLAAKTTEASNALAAISADNIEKKEEPAPAE